VIGKLATVRPITGALDTEGRRAKKHVGWQRDNTTNDKGGDSEGPKTDTPHNRAIIGEEVVGKALHGSEIWGKNANNIIAVFLEKRRRA